MEVPIGCVSAHIHFCGYVHLCRVVMELKETLKSKDEEGDAYVIVIEVRF